MPEHAKPLAYYDHPFFGRWAAITENSLAQAPFSTKGLISATICKRTILRRAITEAGVATDQSLPAGIHNVNGVDRLGKRIHYYFNYTGSRDFHVQPPAGTDLLTEKPNHFIEKVTVPPWDLGNHRRAINQAA